jgi:hypothetical protein
MYTVHYKQPVRNGKSLYSDVKTANSLRECRELIAKIKANNGSVTYIYDNRGCRVDV